MKALIILLAVFGSFTAKCQLSDTEQLKLNTRKSGDYLHQAVNNFAWGFAFGAVGGTATTVSSIYAKKPGLPIGFGAATVSITVTFSISGIVNINRAANALKGDIGAY